MIRPLVALALSLLPALATAAEVAQVLALRGSATVVQGGKSAALEIGAALSEGAEIRTAAPGRVKLKFIDGSVVVIGDDTSFRIDHLRLGSDGKRRAAGFVLDVGLMSQTVAPATGGEWSVRTPTAVTAVRGTEYVVEVTANLSTEVNIRSGSVAVEPIAPPLAMRKMQAGRTISPPVVLDQIRLGTRCDVDTAICSPASPIGAARQKAIEDRLSGV